MQKIVVRTSRRFKNEAPSLQGDFVHHAVWRSLDDLGKRSLSGACSAALGKPNSHRNLLSPTGIPP
jgi:hypothetical protein